MPQLSLAASASGVFAIVTMPHDLDMANAYKVEQFAEIALDSHIPNLIFDLNNLDTMDSSGVKAIVTTYRKIKQHEGTLALVAPRPRIDNLLRITGLKPLLPIYSDLDSAMNIGPVDPNSSPRSHPATDQGPARARTQVPPQQPTKGSE